VEDFDGGGIFGEGKGEGGSFGGVLELWWFPWRWRRKKMKVRSWRSCGGGDEGGVEEGEDFSWWRLRLW